MEILIAGDFVPYNRTKKFVENCRNDVIFGPLKDYFKKADLSILNLESPIVDGNALPIQKAGPNLKTCPTIIESLKYLNIDAVTLANNHFYDYGEKGVLDTLKYLKDNKIRYVGGGKNLKEASEILYVCIDDEKLAIINCCEHEYSIATDTKAGSNPLLPIRQYYKILEARNNADYVLIIVHGGIEGYQLPTPRMKELYEFFIDVGADAVVNHHQHCYSGYEIYNNRPIFYGLGNFSFDWHGKRNDIWNDGFLLKLKFSRNKIIRYGLIPYVQGNNDPGVILMDDKAKSIFNRNIETLNKIITNDSDLANEYQKYLHRTRKSQKTFLNPYPNKFLKTLFIKGILPSFMSSKSLRTLQNKVMCESHQERLLDFLNNRLK